MTKRVTGSRPPKHKQIVERPYSTEQKTIIWVFDMLDNDGAFAFNLDRNDFKHEEVLRKIIAYSNMTWAEVKSQKHDNNKSKHHSLDVSGISPGGLVRVRTKLDESQFDQIFSFALQNKLRLIGIREQEKFHVIWYDPEHKFYPSSK